MIMSEWKEYRLGDICETNKSQYSNKENWHHFKYLDTGNITKGNIDNIQEFDSFESLPSRARRKVTDGDIIYSSVRPNQEHYGYISNPSADILVSTGFIVISANKDIINPIFLYNYLTQPKITKYLQAIGEQSVCTYPAIKPSDIEDLVIKIPSLDIQAIIASILSSLDSKIENNRKICANLEAQAQALFKHWFIDFAPFKDGKFVESELGMIPEGWRVGTYSDIIKDTISGDWGKDSSVGNYNHKVACIRGCDFQDVKMGLRGKTPERFILEKNFQSKHFENKDVLVEISGGTATVSTGRVCPVSQLLIDKYNGDVVCTNFCKLIRPIEGYSSYLYYSWKYKYDRKVMFGYENGTSGIKNFSIKDFTTREPLVLPTLTALNEFEGMIEHIHTQIQNCGSESSKLAVIRDTLLPKLMSGEIKV